MKKILVIDDDLLVLKTFERLLKKENYAVISCASYDEAMAAYEKEAFDLVLSDIRMPGKNGVETVSEIHEKLKKAGKKAVPIIFITGFADVGKELKANFLGEILYKPVDNDKLLYTIRDYL